MRILQPGGRRALALAAAVAALLAAASWHGRAAVPPSEVEIDDFAFSPANLTVQRGATVKWINRDGEPHTVSSAGAAKLLKSPALDTDDSFAFTFEDAGTYRYFCTLHPHMQGTVVVE